RRRTDGQPRRSRDPRNLPAPPRDQRGRHGRADGDAQPGADQAKRLPHDRDESRLGGVRFRRAGTPAGGDGALMRSLRDAFITFRRSPLLSALSVTTIAFSLFAFGLFGLVALNIRQALDRLEDRVEIRAFVADGTSPEALAAAASDIAGYSE